MTGATFAAANIDERDVCLELTEKIKGFLLGDKGFIRPELKVALAKKGVFLQTPLRGNMQDDRPKAFVKWMFGERRLVETVIGQLTERFHIEKIRARDLWHQYARFWRKLLAHTVCIALNIVNGQEPLQFELLIC